MSICGDGVLDLGDGVVDFGDGVLGLGGGFWGWGCVLGMGIGLGEGGFGFWDGCWGLGGAFWGWGGGFGALLSKSNSVITQLYSGSNLLSYGVLQRASHNATILGFNNALQAQFWDANCSRDVFLTLD
jgi:hypothetical protein